MEGLKRIVNAVDKLIAKVGSEKVGDLLESYLDDDVSNTKTITETINYYVCKHFKITNLSVFLHSKEQEVAFCRLIAYWLNNKVAGITFYRIAKHYGKNVSNISRGVDKIQTIRNNRNFNLQINKDIDLLSELINKHLSTLKGIKENN
jgi:chromosomal replication initiation ATPase DnaA